jgi:hypothetical protein
MVFIKKIILVYRKNIITIIFPRLCAHAAQGLMSGEKLLREDTG